MVALPQLASLLASAARLRYGRGLRAVSDSPAAMASYFDEHDCEPLDRERDPRTNMLLELARWVCGAGR